MWWEWLMSVSAVSRLVQRYLQWSETEHADRDPVNTFFDSRLGCGPPGVKESILCKTKNSIMNEETPNGISHDDKTSQWAESVWNWRVCFIDKKNVSHELRSEWASERANEWAQRSARAKRAVRSVANEWAVRANERADERMAQYSMRLFHHLSTHLAVVQLS